MSSTGWTWAADVACALGALMAMLSAALHFRAARRGAPAGNPAGKATLILLYAATALMSAAMWQRWIEVNHFPSQNMSEVISMFTLALLVSMVVLHFALGLQRRGAAWAILDDAMVMLVLASVLATHAYVRTLPNAQRDLPPALQSWWFAPHLSALIFSYATLGIAGLVALCWFCMRLWTGMLAGGYTRKSQLWIAAGLLLIPFAQVVTLPVLLVVGAIFVALKWTGRLPQKETLLALEKSLDDVSYRAFSVGIPFLTAGLFMGAFWAQDAWANYWGWDSKENSALITWLIYVIYIHLRMLGGYRGEKAMAVLVGGALSVFITFQLFGYLPDSQKNTLHRYTEDGVKPREGQSGPTPADESARAESDGDSTARDEVAEARSR